MPPTAAGVTTAILIGDRAGLADEVERRLQAAGTYHVIAISGGNVALIAALAFGLVAPLARAPRVRAVAVMLIVLAYGWIVGPDPSVTRAVAAACLYLAVGLVGLVPRAPHVLGAVAAVVTLVDPLTVVDVGAWLSFGATLGIVLGAGRLAKWTRAPTSAPARCVTARWLIRPAILLLAASVAAEAALLPIGAAVFARVSLAGIVLNFVAIPAMAVVQVGGLAVAVTADWWPGGAAVAAGFTRVAADALIGSARLVDVAPWLSWRTPPTAIGWTLIYYAAWAALLAWPRPAARRAAAVVALTTLAVIAWSPVTSRARPFAGHVRLTMLDVGQGDALFVQFPTGHGLLVDAGGGPGPFDLGGRVVVPAVWALGARRIDWLTVTHGDLDHVGGAAAVVADLHPREIWEGIPVPRDISLQALRDAARARGIVWRTVRAGHALDVGGVSIDVWHPPAPDWERQRVRNDDSVVLRVRYGDVELLLTGDAGVEFERARPDPSGLAPIRLLKAGHHGSRTSSAAAFVDAYRPQVALISVGRGNLFGHPAPAVLARFAAIGAEVFRTDQDGFVTVETDGVSARVRTAGGRSWTVGVLRLAS